MLKQNAETLEFQKTDVLEGASNLLQRNSKLVDRTSYMVEAMPENRAFLEAMKGSTVDYEKALLTFQQRYLEYRRLWKEQPKTANENGLTGRDMIDAGLVPLCIDIETASICDLACPFCYREAIATPDRVIKFSVFTSIIDQAVKLGVPSIKLNWRGEPLLNSKLPEMISYAKKAGILETIINTNATKLNKKTARKLIEAGLDLIIYSFDGGTKETYEKMRPGRFKKNSFEKVYENIKNFEQTRSEMGKKLPMTKIQMILTEDTFCEQESFFHLFDRYVDEVTVTQYSERGGLISDLTKDDQLVFNNLCEKYDLDPETASYMKQADGTMSVALSRLPCEQPFQRLLVTYDGRVAMCCYDWGAMHPVGYLSPESFEDPDKEFKKVLEKVEQGAAGFELLAQVKMPAKLNQPALKVSTVEEVWVGEDIARVRSCQNDAQQDQIKMCAKCPFKDTYNWVS